MYDRFGAWVSRHWLVVILCWIAVLVAIRMVAPRWDDVTLDGDLAYLPSDLPSVRGEQLLQEAFTDQRSKSELVVILARDEGQLDQPDFEVSRDVASRMFNLLGVASLSRARQAESSADRAEEAGDAARAEALRAEAEAQRQQASQAWEEALRLSPKSPWAMHNRGILYRERGDAEQAEREQKLAVELEPSLAESPDRLFPDPAGLDAVIDVWTPATRVVGEKLVSKNRSAVLVVVKLASEFMAVENIALFGEIERQLDEVRAAAPTGLKIGVTGSAAVGADMLLSAKESIENTELYTILMVLAILAVVYRAPLLVAVPMVTIGMSIFVALGLIAMLTQLDEYFGWEFWNFNVFTTTKIFVIVILFGSGTDFCLFLISRYKEELDAGRERTQALSIALSRVTDALLGSAFTTIVGLGMMFFAEFGKFRNSGPAIGLCLLVTLLACLTLAPALLRLFGGSVFWPFGMPTANGSAASETAAHRSRWNWIARLILARPGLILVTCVLLMMPFAVVGSTVEVTYDFLSELDPSRPSKVGTAMMQRHFPVGETGPLVVLVERPGADFETREGMLGLMELTGKLYVPGVESVRSLMEPLGEKPQRASLFGNKLGMRSHALVQGLYIGRKDNPQGEVARFDLVLNQDPFSEAAIASLNAAAEVLEQEVNDPDSYWHQAKFSFAGTTAGIRDLQVVTRSDNLRIQVLVVLAVLAILLMLLRRPLICFYMIASVLFSFYVSIGATELFCVWMYGDTFQGLDWKVPLFLFVILVAIGEDYNIYLTTRVFQEQPGHGLLPGLRRAIERTGGIITSCGIIMAGTFVSMMTGSLRGIAELGFALTLGVLLDTFVVRTILLPAFMAILFRRVLRRQGDAEAPVPSPHHRAVSVKP